MYKNKNVYHNSMFKINKKKNFMLCASTSVDNNGTGL